MIISGLGECDKDGTHRHGLLYNQFGKQESETAHDVIQALLQEVLCNKAVFWPLRVIKYKQNISQDQDAMSHTRNDESGKAT